MRLHFPEHNPTTDPGLIDEAYAALHACQAAGTIAKHVSFKTISRHNRNGGGAAIEVQFETYERDRGRRAGNSGSYGAMYDGTYTATYDEWGFFLAELYRHHEDIICGSAKYPYYSDASDFHEKTGRTYDSAYPDYVERYGDDFGFRYGRNQIGRRGAGRIHHDSSQTRYATEDIRTAEWIRKLQAGEVF